MHAVIIILISNMFVSMISDFSRNHIFVFFMITDFSRHHMFVFFMSVNLSINLDDQGWEGLSYSKLDYRIFIW